MEFIHLLLSNLIGQNVQAMVQEIYSPHLLQPYWSECYNHGISVFTYCFSAEVLLGK